MSAPTPKTLVVYFSRPGNNYGVGNVAKGNTKILAELIAAHTSGTLFEVERVNPYPEAYSPCTEEAKAELNQNLRPEIKSSLDNIDEYNTVFVGYPVWWGEPPMPLLTFLEKYDFTGKRVIPFCTHEGSGLCGVSTVGKSSRGCTLENKAFEMTGTTAQRNDNNTKTAVENWLKRIGF